MEKLPPSMWCQFEMMGENDDDNSDLSENPRFLTKGNFFSAMDVIKCTLIGCNSIASTYYSKKIGASLTLKYQEKQE